MPILKSKVNLRRHLNINIITQRPSQDQLTVKTEMIVKQERLVKNLKIEEHDDHHSYTTNDCSNSPHNSQPSYTSEVFTPTIQPSKISQHVGKGDSKNIIKNYGKALCAFASSKTALPYTKEFIKKNGLNGIKVSEFMNYYNSKKSSIKSMDKIRSLLIAEDGDSNTVRVYKAIFQYTSIVFLKFFAVNWIYNGKLVQKTVHLNFRFKMLRRIQNPELFTYLKTKVK